MIQCGSGFDAGSFKELQGIENEFTFYVLSFKVLERVAISLPKLKT
jgi:hypothetical protein